MFHVDKEQIPELCCNTVQGFFFSFIVAKHPLEIYVNSCRISAIKNLIFIPPFDKI